MSASSPSETGRSFPVEGLSRQAKRKSRRMTLQPMSSSAVFSSTHCLRLSAHPPLWLPCQPLPQRETRPVPQADPPPRYRTAARRGPVPGVSDENRPGCPSLPRMQKRHHDSNRYRSGLPLARTTARYLMTTVFNTARALPCRQCRAGLRVQTFPRVCRHRNTRHASGNSMIGAFTSFRFFSQGSKPIPFAPAPDTLPAVQSP